MKLTDSNYFSKEVDKEYISNSQLKNFAKCEAAALAELNGEYERPKTDALTIGSYVDIALTGSDEELEVFKTNHPEIFSSRGETKGQLLAKYKHADLMVERAKSDEYFMKTLNGVNQAIMTGDISGIPVKVKIDSLLEKAIVDLKTCESLRKVYYKDGQRVSFIENFDYISQGAIYQEIVRQNTDKTLPFFLSCVSKEDEPDLAVIQIDNETLANRLNEIKERIVEVDMLKKGIVEPKSCGKCAYCRKTKKLSRAINWQDVEIGD